MLNMAKKVLFRERAKSAYFRSATILDETNWNSKDLSWKIDQIGCSPPPLSPQTMLFFPAAGQPLKSNIVLGGGGSAENCIKFQQFCPELSAEFSFWALEFIFFHSGSYKRKFSQILVTLQQIEGNRHQVQLVIQGTPAMDE